MDGWMVDDDWVMLCASGSFGHNTSFRHMTFDCKFKLGNGTKFVIFFR